MKILEEQKSPCKECLSRREAFGIGAQVALGAAALGLIASCGSSSKSSTGGNSGGTSVSTDSSGNANLDFATYPNLKAAGGSYRVNINSKPISVTRLTSSMAIAVLAVCTHAGATLDDVSGSTMTCPKHGAVFNTDGSVVSGPVSTNLTTYTAAITSSGITVSVT